MALDPKWRANRDAARLVAAYNAKTLNPPGSIASGILTEMIAAELLPHIEHADKILETLMRLDAESVKRQAELGRLQARLAEFQHHTWPDRIVDAIFASDRTKGKTMAPTPTTPSIKIDLFTLLPLVASLTGELQRDLADGKITLDEGVSLIDLLAQNAYRYLPGMALEATLVITLCKAFRDYQVAKGAEQVPK